MYYIKKYEKDLKKEFKYLYDNYVITPKNEMVIKKRLLKVYYILSRLGAEVIPYEGDELYLFLSRDVKELSTKALKFYDTVKYVKLIRSALPYVKDILKKNTKYVGVPTEQEEYYLDVYRDIHSVIHDIEMWSYHFIKENS